MSRCEFDCKCEYEPECMYEFLCKRFIELDQFRKPAFLADWRSFAGLSFFVLLINLGILKAKLCARSFVCKYGFQGNCQILLFSLEIPVP